MKRAKKYRSESGNVRILLLLVMAAVAGSVYVLYERPELVQKYLPALSPTPAPDPSVTPQPPPEPAPLATSEPTLKPTPEVAPVATPVTEATPEPILDFEKIAATPTLWPKEVALVREAVFPLILNGKVVGQATAPAGTLLPVLQVLPDPTKRQVEVMFQNNREIVSASASDLIARATALKKSAPANPR